MSKNRSSKPNGESFSPFIKWVGGKRAIAHEILDLAQVTGSESFKDGIKKYIEPFLGGGAMFFHLKNIGLINDETNVVLSDMNRSLIITYEVVQGNCEALIKRLKMHANNHSMKDVSWADSTTKKEAAFNISKKKPNLDEGHYYYYYVRDFIYNRLHKQTSLSPSGKVELAAAFIYLNRTGFNGMYRENAAGEMNIPRGRYVNPAIVNEDVLRLAGVALKGVKIDCVPYSESIKKASKGTLVYMDPPYYETFNDYNQGGFGKDEQEELAKSAEDISAKNVKVVISNSCDAGGFILALYKRHGLSVVTELKAARNINSDGKGRSKVKEIVAFS